MVTLRWPQAVSSEFVVNDPCVTNTVCVVRRVPARHCYSGHVGEDWTDRNCIHKTPRGCPCRIVVEMDLSIDVQRRTTKHISTVQSSCQGVI